MQRQLSQDAKNIQRKEIILKEVQETWQLAYKGKNSKITSDLSSVPLRTWIS